MPDLEDVKMVVDFISTKAMKLNFKFKLFIYGSILDGYGQDMDIIVELPKGKFEEYRTQCILMEDGLFPFSDQFLTNFSSMFWMYFSPKEGRSNVALKTIGIDIEEMAGKLEIESCVLDIVCLPRGWDNPDTEVFNDLKKDLMGSCDPHFLENASE